MSGLESSIRNFPFEIRGDFPLVVLDVCLLEELVTEVFELLLNDERTNILQCDEE